ncbi:restriction endonuclease [Cotonvirus japonicus]|uniref:Restriction endonuclease n=1 Tax=Cotonvirus japonicus TaxID=2811091 RepID=A0ABM7NTG0_9VIRU|nr:restriction endonuclease [Cotonvirus japonicus]BCS83462.1 restriction endonuclease [Cotonvirus japonicus]
MKCDKKNKQLCSKETCKVCFEKSFASHPKSKFWSDKNEISPREVMLGSSKKLKFDCECGHEIEMRLCDVKMGKWCVFCNNQKICHSKKCESCYKKSLASHPKAKFWSDKNEILPREITLGSAKKFKFDCKCGHEIEMCPNSIERGRWCAFCANKALCGSMDCETCISKSFFYHEKAEYWSEDNEYTSMEVFNKSGKKCIFDCVCGHTFEMGLNSIGKNRWCPYCANQKLCGNKFCDTCHNKSFASHPKAIFWSNKNDCNPREVFKKSGKKYMFDCVCGHLFKIQLCSISLDKWCSYCGSHTLCDKKNCDPCYKKSFASYPKSLYWADENDCGPRDVFKGSHKKYKFVCENGHEFESMLAFISRGVWCPKCMNKTEQKLYKWLSKHYVGVIQQAKFNWCMKKNHLPFDFAIEDLKILIELDGEQHFTQVQNWTSPDSTQENDIFKTIQANKNSYTIIRLLQDDVWNDKIDWKHKLTEYLHTRKSPTCIYIASDPDKYNIHKQLLSVANKIKPKSQSKTEKSRKSLSKTEKSRKSQSKTEKSRKSQSKTTKFKYVEV